MINFGQYDRKVSFIKLGQVSDSYGGYIPTESTILTTFAAAKQMKGSNSLEEAQYGFPQTMIFYIQKRSGFTPSVDMLIKYKNETHLIKSYEQTSERGSYEWKIIAVRTEL